MTRYAPGRGVWSSRNVTSMTSGRQCSTWLSERGVSESLVEKVLAHAQGGKVTRRYEKPSWEALVVSLNRLPYLTRPGPREEAARKEQEEKERREREKAARQEEQHALLRTVVEKLGEFQAVHLQVETPEEPPSDTEDDRKERLRKHVADRKAFLDDLHWMMRGIEDLEKELQSPYTGTPTEGSACTAPDEEAGASPPRTGRSCTPAFRVGL